MGGMEAGKSQQGCPWERWGNDRGYPRPGRGRVSQRAPAGAQREAIPAQEHKAGLHKEAGWQTQAFRYTSCKVPYRSDGGKDGARADS